MQFIKIFYLVILLSFLTSCTHIYSDYGLSTRYVYPNSDVHPLQNVSAETDEEWSFLSIPEYSVDDLKILQTQALSKANISNANALIDYNVQVKYANYIFFNKSQLFLQGYAVRMDVGKQEDFNKK